MRHVRRGAMGGARLCECAQDSRPSGDSVARLGNSDAVIAAAEIFSGRRGSGRRPTARPMARS
jgi:hypothetical protein